MSDIITLSVGQTVTTSYGVLFSAAGFDHCSLYQDSEDRVQLILIEKTPPILTAEVIKGSIDYSDGALHLACANGTRIKITGDNQGVKKYLADHTHLDMTVEFLSWDCEDETHVIELDLLATNDVQSDGAGGLVIQGRGRLDTLYLRIDEGQPVLYISMFDASPLRVGDVHRAEYNRVKHCLAFKTEYTDMYLINLPTAVLAYLDAKKFSVIANRKGGEYALTASDSALGSRVDVNEVLVFTEKHVTEDCVTSGYVFPAHVTKVENNIAIQRYEKGETIMSAIPLDRMYVVRRVQILDNGIELLTDTTLTHIDFRHSFQQVAYSSSSQQCYIMVVDILSRKVHVIPLARQYYRTFRNTLLNYGVRNSCVEMHGKLFKQLTEVLTEYYADADITRVTPVD